MNLSTLHRGSTQATSGFQLASFYAQWKVERRTDDGKARLGSLVNVGDGWEWCETLGSIIMLDTF